MAEPWASASGGNVLVPEVLDHASVANLAGNSVLDERHSSDDARLPVGLAVRAHQAAFVDVATAVLASSLGKLLAHSSIHIGLEQPVSDLVSLSSRNQLE